MNTEEFIKAISIDNKIITKRCTETYLKKYNLYDWLIQNSPKDFETIRDKITYLRFGGGYCKVCNVRTNLASKNGFGNYCKLHFHEPKKNKKAHNSKEIDIELIKDLYFNKKMSVLQISKEIGNISNVSISKKLKELNISLRNQSETCSLCAIPRDKSFLYDKEWWIKEYSTKSSEEIAKELGCSSSLVLQRLAEYNIKRTIKDTFPEKRLMEFLDSINIIYEKKVKGLIKGNKEIDIFIPHKNLGIEINGLHWHSELYKNSSYHLNKTKECIDNNIELLHFWDSEIAENFDIIKSIIKTKLGLNRKIHARKCIIIEIDSKTAKEFMIKNHMQGWSNSKICYGLLYNNELVAVATFGKPRFNKEYEWELIRFASSLETSVIGGMSKLLKNIKGNIISYANRRWSLGNAYDKCGFILKGISEPAYFYTKDFIKLHNRMKFRKHLLKDMEGYSEDKSEHEIMYLNGYRRIWDCGQLVYTRNSFN